MARYWQIVLIIWSTVHLIIAPHIGPDDLTFEHSEKFGIFSLEIFPVREGIDDYFSRNRKAVEIPFD